MNVLLKELTQFLSKTARLDLKAVSLTHILGLTGTKAGIELIGQNLKLLGNVVALVDDDSDVIRKDAVLALVNISAEESGAEVLVNKFLAQLVPKAYASILDETSKLSDPWSMLLCNLSRPEQFVEAVLEELHKIEHSIDKLTTCFTRVNYNQAKGHLNYLGPLFSNLSQCRAGREIFCNRTTGLLVRILPFVHHEGSIVRRGGAVGLLKNICFDSNVHQWLLDDGIDVLPFILLPLAGPEEFDDEINDKLPVELQYLGPDKKREEDPDIRKMLLESLAQLCATKKGREHLRGRGTYEVLRELHKFECGSEGDPRVLVACENVVDILIRTEDEIGEDNLKTLEIPEDMKQKIEDLNDNK
ncbi:protein HGH1 homolog [Uranotaenia lowii]|uniref:protein HGH1 homolog n=1 Tax=Uranotaenia lowii TaxID=190385 RepID=UPI00247A1957|nr:protein HGH1 homolog [Uranotaenia lowii]XP_055602863.1 protein HGH1 homolog [Uranotaenia lowii]